MEFKIGDKVTVRDDAPEGTRAYGWRGAEGVVVHPPMGVYSRADGIRVKLVGGGPDTTYFIEPEHLTHTTPIQVGDTILVPMVVKDRRGDELRVTVQDDNLGVWIAERVVHSIVARKKEYPPEPPWGSIVLGTTTANTGESVSVVVWRRNLGLGSVRNGQSNWTNLLTRGAAMTWQQVVDDARALGVTLSQYDRAQLIKIREEKR